MVAVPSPRDYPECKRVPRLCSHWSCLIELCSMFKVDNVDKAVDPKDLIDIFKK